MAKEEILLHFKGPFSLSGDANSIFKSSYVNESGLYLWTIKNTTNHKNYIHYIGETEKLAKRQREHLVNVLGLNYGIFDPIAARAGKLMMIWPGLWRLRKAEDTPRALIEYAKIGVSILEYLNCIDVFFAVTDTTKEIRKHVEGCIGRNLRENHPDKKILYPDDNRVIAKGKPIGAIVKVTSDVFIEGLDSSLPV